MAAQTILRGGPALLILVVLTTTHARDLANCTQRTRLCNGAYLCEDACTRGTLVPDPWATRALELQRALAYDEPLARNTFIGSHNSAISLAYGYGIESDGVHALTNTSVYGGDDLGEGVCASFTLTDQLNMGLRHLEIDITAEYEELHPLRIDVCHSPVPLSPSLPFLELPRAAKRAGVDLGADYSPMRFSCVGTSTPLLQMLMEVRSWLDAHPSDFLVLYLDTKPLTVAIKAQADAVSTLLRTAFGDAVYPASNGEAGLLNSSVRELVRRGYRLYVEDHQPAYAKASDRIVFTPALWTHQFDSSSLQPFPNCSIGGDGAWYSPVGGPFRRLARGLYSDGSTLVDGTAARHDGMRAMGTRCGVNVISANYVQPRDMGAFVWTWDEGEPRLWRESEPRSSWREGGELSTGCVVQRPNGRWGMLPCEAARKLPLACRRAADDRVWTLAAPARRTGGGGAAAAVCGAGWLARPPTNGYANALLRVAAGASVVMLNTSVDGRGASPALAAEV